MSAATGNEPNARLNVALCDETIRDDPTRAVSLLRAEILDVIHTMQAAGFVSDSENILRLAIDIIIFTPGGDKNRKIDRLTST